MNICDTAEPALVEELDVKVFVQDSVVVYVPFREQTTESDKYKQVQVWCHNGHYEQQKLAEFMLGDQRCFRCTEPRLFVNMPFIDVQGVLHGFIEPVQLGWDERVHEYRYEVPDFESMKVK